MEKQFEESIKEYNGKMKKDNKFERNDVILIIFGLGLLFSCSMVILSFFIPINF